MISGRNEMLAPLVTTWNRPFWLWAVCLIRKTAMVPGDCTKPSKNNHLKPNCIWLSALGGTELGQDAISKDLGTCISVKTMLPITWITSNTLSSVTTLKTREKNRRTKSASSIPVRMIGSSMMNGLARTWNLLLIIFMQTVQSQRKHLPKRIHIPNTFRTWNIQFLIQQTLPVTAQKNSW